MANATRMGGIFSLKQSSFNALGGDYNTFPLEYVLVGGGGSGGGEGAGFGTDTGAGGGGGGGFITNENQTSYKVQRGVQYFVVVGAGGAGGALYTSANGTPSCFNTTNQAPGKTLVAYGGGGGGNYAGSQSSNTVGTTASRGKSGASGGGGMGYHGGAGGGVAIYGNQGGAGGSGMYGTATGGGGGGAGYDGMPANSNNYPNDYGPSIKCALPFHSSGGAGRMAWDGQYYGGGGGGGGAASADPNQVGRGTGGTLQQPGEPNFKDSRLGHASGRETYDRNTINIGGGYLASCIGASCNTYWGGGGSGARGNGNNTQHLTAAQGIANSGGGGGGGGATGNYATAGTQTGSSSGASGIVMLRYSDEYPAAVSSSAQKYVVLNGYRYYTFTSTGSITF